MFERATNQRKFIKVGLWGPLKQGKTEFALGFPKVCVIDGAKGTHLFDDRYTFNRKDVIYWRDLKAPLQWLRDNPKHGFETLLIDDVTPLYSDLVEEVGQAEKARTGRDFLTQIAWQIIKRRFRAFLRVLLELPMHVVVTVRAKEEYESIPAQGGGEDKFKKTGEVVADIDKALLYDLDFILNCAIDDGNAKGAKKDASKLKFTVKVMGSRRAEVPLYHVYDITGKRGYDVVFKDLAEKLAKGTIVIPITTPTEDMDIESHPSHTAVTTPVSQTSPLSIPAGVTPVNVVAQPTPPASPGTPIGKQSPTQVAAKIEAFFGASPPATADDLKVLFTRAGQMEWPDGTQFNSEDAKKMLKGLYKVESSKDLTKGQVDQLYVIFGQVLSKKSKLVRYADGIVSWEPINIPF